MSQSRATSIEAIVNVTAGYGLAVLVQLVVFPVYGLQVSLAENLRIGLIFTWRRSFAATRPGAGSSGGGGWSDHRGFRKRQELTDARAKA
jgi:hypothetical protein